MMRGHEGRKLAARRRAEVEAQLYWENALFESMKEAERLKQESAQLKRDADRFAEEKNRLLEFEEEKHKKREEYRKSLRAFMDDFGNGVTKKKLFRKKIVQDHKMEVQDLLVGRNHIFLLPEDVGLTERVSWSEMLW